MPCRWASKSTCEVRATHTHTDPCPRIARSTTYPLQCCSFKYKHKTNNGNKQQGCQAHVLLSRTEKVACDCTGTSLNDTASAYESIRMTWQALQCLCFPSIGCFPHWLVRLSSFVTAGSATGSSPEVLFEPADPLGLCEDGKDPLPPPCHPHLPSPPLPQRSHQ
jgi:hypothetical protein